MSTEQTTEKENKLPEFEKSEIQGFLPENLYHFISEFSEKIKMDPQEKRRGRLPRSTRILVSRMKSEARRTNKPQLEIEAEKIAETERLQKLGYTERQVKARGRLNYQIEHLSTLAEEQREEQVLTGMKISWYAYAVGLLERDRMEEIIREIDDLNPMQIKKFDDNETWVKVFKEEINPILPLIR